MNTERWRQISQLYDAALAREGDCAAFLKHACADDEELRRDVESLLAQLASAEAFLTQPALVMAANVVSDPGPSMRTGHRIGESQVQSELLNEGLADRYRIERELGRGGMATVYLADDLKHGRNELRLGEPDAPSGVSSARLADNAKFPRKGPVH